MRGGVSVLFIQVEGSPETSGTLFSCASVSRANTENKKKNETFFSGMLDK